MFDIESSDTINAAIAKAQMAIQAVVDDGITKISVQVRDIIHETLEELSSLSVEIPAMVAFHSHHGGAITISVRKEK